MYADENEIQPTHLITEAVRLWCQPGGVYELRCPKSKALKLGTVSGYFSDPGALANTAVSYDGYVEAVYLTLNPVRPECLGRANNRAEEWVKYTTKDHEIVRRSRLLIDCDAEAPVKGVSSTDAEHEQALEAARDVRRYLTGLGWPSPLMASSGNGGHLQYAIDLPNDEPAGRLLSEVLQALKARWPCVDETTFNASRVCKLYGTLVKKGDQLPDRPHRRSSIIEAPDRLEPVPTELLRALAGHRSIAPVSLPPTPCQAPARPADPCPRLTPEAEPPAWVAAHGLGIARQGDYRGGYKWALRKCPFSGQHTDPEDGTGAVVIRRPDGRLAFKCQHKSCEGKRYEDVLARFNEGSETAPKKPADRLLALARKCELWHSPDRMAYATSPGGANMSVAGTEFRNWLTGEYLKATGQGAGRTALEQAVATAQALAVHEGRCHRTHLRTARGGDRLYIDLGDPSWRAVEVSPEGWRVVSPPVKFVRNGNTAPLPVPVQGGSIDLLRPFVNVSEDQFPLVVGLLLDALKGHGPYLVGIFTGEQGASKSTVCRVIKSLADPVHKAELASCPRDERDLGCLGENNHVLAFDNLSKLPPWMSDALCRLATGGGITTRKLYKDAEQQIFDLCRPVLANGIEDFATASDLLSRAVPVTVDVISPEARRTEADFWTSFRQAQPLILGALLDALRQALACPVTPGNLPRMAESASWIASCCPAFGWNYETWQEPYQAAQAVGSGTAVASSVVATVLLRWWQAGLHPSGWEGTATELYDELLPHAEDRERRLWPVGAAQFSGKLRKDTPALRTLGIDVRHGTIRRKQRGIFIKWADAADAATEDGPAIIPAPAPAPQDDRLCGLHQAGGNNGRAMLLPTLPTLPTAPFSVEEIVNGRCAQAG